MTHHLKDSSNNNELDTILNRLRENNIPFIMDYDFNGKITSLETDDIELINYAEKNNPSLVESL